MVNTLKKLKKSELKPGVRVVLNGLADATVYVVGKVAANGLQAELTYYAGGDTLDGGSMDYSLMYRPTAEQMANSVVKLGPVFAYPELDIDKLLYKPDGVPHANGKYERRIVYNFLLHLYANGFKLHTVDDGEEDTEIAANVPRDEAIRQAMELVFNLDEVRLYFSVVGLDHKCRYMAYFVLGEGETILTDYSAPNADLDNWNATMEAFNPEDYA